MSDNSTTRFKLVCVPYAGGTAMAFNNIKFRLKNIDCIVLELPGRGNRVNEPFNDSLEDALECFTDKIRSGIVGQNVGLVFWGHSMGAMLAYLLAEKFLNETEIPVYKLIVSALKGPAALKPNKPLIHRLESKDFLAAFNYSVGGNPFRLSSDRENLTAYFEPNLRADIRILELYLPRLKTHKKLPVSIDVIYGSKDILVKENYKSWQEESMYPINSTEVEGGHFFILENPKTTAIVLANILNTINTEIKTVT